MFGTKVLKGTKMAGHMGGKNATMQNLLVYKIIPQHNLLLVVGSVTGPKGSIVRIRDAWLPPKGVRAARMNPAYPAPPPPFPTFLPGDPGDDDLSEIVLPPFKSDPHA